MVVTLRSLRVPLSAGLLLLVALSGCTTGGETLHDRMHDDGSIEDHEDDGDEHGDESMPDEGGNQPDPSIPTNTETDASGPNSSPGTECKTPTVGDFATMEATTTVQGTISNVTVRNEILRSESVTVRGTTYQAWYSEGTIDGSTEVQGTTQTQDGEIMGWTTDCGGAVKSIVDLNVTSSGNGFSIGSTSHTVSENHAECFGLRFPVTIGDEYSQSCTSTTTSDSTVNGQSSSDTQTTTSTITYEVLANEEVTVPAGTFTTAKIEMSIDDDGESVSSFQWYARAECVIVKTETALGDGGSTVAELTDYLSQDC